MAIKKDNKPEEGGPDQSWIITFCDCMTLLLCFFVLLLSFSSFDEVRFNELAGALRSMNRDSIRKNKEEKRDSFFKAMKQPEQKNAGSIVPTNFQRSNSTLPSMEIFDLDIEKYQTVFYLPSQQLFWVNGISMTQKGRKLLAAFTKYMELAPCRIIIAESSGQAHRNLGLRRAWTVMRFFVQQRGIAKSRFSLSEDCDSPSDRFGGKPFLEITLLNARIDE